MNKTKIFSILVLIFSFIAFALTFLLYTTREDEKEKRMLAEQENIILETRNNEFLAQINELKSKEDDYKIKIDKFVSEKKDLLNKVDRATQEKERALEKISAEQIKAESVQKEFDDYKKKTSEIVNDFKAQNQRLLEKIEDLKREAVKRPVASMSVVPQQSFTQAQVEIPKVVVSPSNSLQGHVLVINKKYNFFITDLGKQDGVKIGQEVSVFRDNVLVATAKVEKLYDNLCASGILKENAALSVEEGDVVKVSK